MARLEENSKIGDVAKYVIDIAADELPHTYLYAIAEAFLIAVAFILNCITGKEKAPNHKAIRIRVI